jgi:hypothetical protein
MNDTGPHFGKSKQKQEEIISLQGKKCKKINFFQNQNDTCAHLFTLVMKCHDRQSSERCIRKLISHHCLDKTRTGWNDFLFLITDDRDFRPQTCTNGLVFRECKHIKNIFEDVYFTKNSFHITLKMKKIDHLILSCNVKKVGKLVRFKQK